jgi:hypothetical protein
MLSVVEEVRLLIDKDKIQISKKYTDSLFYKSVRDGIILIAYRSLDVDPDTISVYHIQVPVPSVVRPDVEFTFHDSFEEVLPSFGITKEGIEAEVERLSKMMEYLSQCDELSPEHDEFLEAYTEFIRDHTAFSDITHEVPVGRTFYEFTHCE